MDMREAERAEIAERVASIAAMPLEVLPDGPARRALVERAESGLDTEAYTSIVGRWNIWTDERRWTPAEWLAQFAS